MNNLRIAPFVPHLVCNPASLAVGGYGWEIAFTSYARSFQHFGLKFDVLGVELFPSFHVFQEGRYRNSERIKRLVAHEVDNINTFSFEDDKEYCGGNDENGCKDLELGKERE